MPDLAYDASGWCPICEAAVRFTADNAWLRDHLLCGSCGSLPRERALSQVLTELLPRWRQLAVLESSPADRGISRKLRLQAPGYLGTQWRPDLPTGSLDEWGYRVESLDALSLADETFDLVVTLDVMEHVNDPESCFVEIARVLRQGGWYLFTVPTDVGRMKSERVALYQDDGSVELYAEAEYHGNPISDAGSLVTWRWGRDLPELVRLWSGMDCWVTRWHDSSIGVLGEHTDVYACRRPGPYEQPSRARPGLVDRLRRRWGRER
jgi:SAM-dependent methyltransferase